jgi:uncharacterized membrane protein YozB (DUF420 family)
MTMVGMILLLLCTLGGFGATYYFNIENALTFRFLTHVHVLTMSLWIILLMAQITLVRTGNVKLHMKLGIFGVVLVSIMIPVGLIVGVQAAKSGSQSFPGEVPALSFLAVPFLSMLIFATLFAAAIIRRKHSADHRRLMLLTMVSLLGPGLARVKVEALAQLGPLLFIGFPLLVGMVLLAGDSWRNRKVNIAFLIGTIFLTIAAPLMLPIGGTGIWLKFAEWITSI